MNSDTMARKDPSDMERDCNESSSSQKGVASQLKAAPAQSAFSAFNGISSSQFPYVVDHSAILMSNAAAAIAAVAASAVQQMSQGNKNQNGSVGMATAAPGLVAAARTLLSSHASHSSTSASGQLNPHIAAALLGVAGSSSSMAFPMKVQSGGSSNGSTHQGLASKPAPVSSHAAALSSGPTVNALLPGMETWSLEHLGELLVLH